MCAVQCSNEARSETAYLLVVICAPAVFEFSRAEAAGRYSEKVPCLSVQWPPKRCLNRCPFSKWTSPPTRAASHMALGTFRAVRSLSSQGQRRVLRRFGYLNSEVQFSPTKIVSRFYFRERILSGSRGVLSNLADKRQSREVGIPQLDAPRSR